MLIDVLSGHRRTTGVPSLCYEKCGFHYAKAILAPDGQTEHIMTVERQTAHED
jgi:hypothetical protein